MSKRITFDKLTKDFRAEVDGILIGFFRTRLEAENACNAYTFESLRRAA